MKKKRNWLWQVISQRFTQLYIRLVRQTAVLCGNELMICLRKFRAQFSEMGPGSLRFIIIYHYIIIYNQ